MYQLIALNAKEETSASVLGNKKQCSVR